MMAKLPELRDDDVAGTSAAQRQRRNHKQEPLMLRHWLIAHDLDASADDAAAEAAAIADGVAVVAPGERPRLVLAHVVNPVPLVVSPDVMGLPDISAGLAADIEDAQRALSERAAVLAARWPRLTVEAQLLRGPTVLTLLEAIERSHVDAVAIGSHNRRGIAHALLGSIAESLVAKARKPVLVVHPAPPSGWGAVM